MKKSTVRAYNIIAFVILPIVIILLSLIVFLSIRREIIMGTVDTDAVTSSTQSGELYEVLAIEEDEAAYVIYAKDDYYELDEENELIAFQSSDVEEINDTIKGCGYEGFATSYWEGEGRSFDASGTHDFEEYLEEIRSGTYAAGKEPNLEGIITEFSSVTLYDLGDYKGYEHGYNNGISLSIAFIAIAVAIVGIILLVMELIIATILKCTVFMVKKG